MSTDRKMDELFRTQQRFIEFLGDLNTRDRLKYGDVSCMEGTLLELTRRVFQEKVDFRQVSIDLNEPNNTFGFDFFTKHVGSDDEIHLLQIFINDRIEDFEAAAKLRRAWLFDLVSPDELAV